MLQALLAGFRRGLEYRFAEGGFDRLPPSYRLLARDCGPHRDAGQMRWVILDLGELPCLMEVTKLNPGPSGEDAERGQPRDVGSPCASAR
jgi:hypothetical protein